MKNDTKRIAATGKPTQEYIVVCLGTEIDSIKTCVGYEAAVAAVKEVRDEIAERFYVDNPERDETWFDTCDMDREEGFKLYNMDEVYQTAFIVKQPETLLDKIKYRLLLIKNAISQSNDLVDSCVDEIEKLAAELEEDSSVAESNSETEERDTVCPACGGAIEPKGGIDNGYGELKLHWECPSCGTTGSAVYDIHDNNSFSYHEIDTYGEKVIECESETCAFNPDGICKYKAVYGKEPVLHDDGCTGYCGKEE